MAVEAAEVIKQALELPLLDRVRVVDELQRSMAPPLDPVVEAALIEEMDRRWQRIESGEEELLDHDEVLAKLNVKYQI